MRIIGGAYRGLRIPNIARRGHRDRRDALLTTRPMTDRMRESLFMVLELRVPLNGACVADLFAGSGIVVAEALSRGAAEAAVCDLSSQAVRHLRSALPPPIYREKKLTIYRQRAEIFVRLATQSYDVIFLDPPYSYPHHAPLLAAVRASHLFAETSVIVIHYRRGTELDLATSRLASVWRKEYGGSVVEILRMS